MAKKATTTAAPAADQTEAVALSRIEAFVPIELDIVRDILPMKGRQYDLTTTGGLQDAKHDLKTVNSYLKRLEDSRKVTKEEPYRLCVLIDAEAKRIAGPIEADIKAPLKLAIDAEDGRQAAIEAARVEAIQKRIALISKRPAWGAKACDIQTMLGYVESVEIDAAFAELQDTATVAKAEALRDLRQMLATAQEVERQQAEQEAERKRLADEGARLREQVASQAVPVASVTVTPEMARLDKPGAVHALQEVVAFADSDPRVALHEILSLCDNLTFAVDSDEGYIAVNRVRKLAKILLSRLP
jgi:hypothetical protein